MIHVERHKKVEDFLFLKLCAISAEADTFLGKQVDGNGTVPESKQGASRVLIMFTWYASCSYSWQTPSRWCIVMAKKLSKQLVDLFW